MRYEFINVNIRENVNNNKMYRWQKKRKEKYIVKKMFLSKGRNELLLILIRKAKLAKHLMRNAIICTAACTAPIELSALSLSLYSPLPPTPPSLGAKYSTIISFEGNCCWNDLE